MHGEYLLLLALSPGSVVGLDRLANLGVFRQWRRLLVALVPLEIAILAWDALGVERRSWSSNKAVLAGPYAFGGRIPSKNSSSPSSSVPAPSPSSGNSSRSGKWEVGNKKHTLLSPRRRASRRSPQPSASAPGRTRLGSARQPTAPPPTPFPLPTSHFPLPS
ncbi:MAG: hypothetical protein U0841_17925 [Chloroflexia bacterium]